jgi:hypothetical protein
MTSSPLSLLAAPARRARAPSWLLLGAEPLRAACEYASVQWMSHDDLPEGDGHPVLLFPGLALDERTLAPLKNLCLRLGYDAHDWGRGMNTGPEGDVDTWLHALADEVAQHADRAGEPVSLIGWSLGGIYAREVARVLGPAHARRVITIGTPFAGRPELTNAGLLYRLLNGAHPQVPPDLQQRLAKAPPVPTTSIYSRTDGVVAWQACLQRSRRRDVENVEVQGSHCGLGWNPDVLRVVARHLARPVPARRTV